MLIFSNSSSQELVLSHIQYQVIQSRLKIDYFLSKLYQGLQYSSEIPDSWPTIDTDCVFSCWEELRIFSTCCTDHAISLKQTVDTTIIHIRTITAFSFGEDEIFIQPKSIFFWTHAAGMPHSWARGLLHVCIYI